MKKLFAALAVVPLLGISGAAFAAQPVQLTNHQMDGVTAGAASGVLINLTAIASGTGQAFTETQGGGGIIQAPIVFPTPLGNVSLLGGAVLAVGSSTSSN